MSFFAVSVQAANRGASKVIDVTVPVQCQVKDSRLFLTEASKVVLQIVSFSLRFIFFRVLVRLTLVCSTFSVCLTL